MSISLINYFKYIHYEYIVNIFIMCISSVITLNIFITSYSLSNISAIISSVITLNIFITSNSS